MKKYGAAALLPTLLLLALPALAGGYNGPPGATAPAGTVWRSNSSRAADYNSALEYGLVADGYTAADGSISAGSNSFSSASRNCLGTDVGKVLTVSGAGAVDGTGALDPLVTTVSGCSGNNFLLAANATTTQSGVPWAYGTDDAGALATALANSPRGIVRLPPGGILLNASTVTLKNAALECVKAPNFDTNSFASNGQGQYGTTFLLTSLSTPPFWLGNSMRVAGCNFYWPGQSGIGRNPGAYPAQPTLTTAGGGSLSAGTYYAEITYLTSSVESPRSVETSIAVSASGTLTAALPAKIAAGADHWNLYLGTSSGGEVLQNASPIAIGTTSDAISTLTTGTAAAPPPFVPVAFPPLFESHAGTGQFVDDRIADNTVVNAYDILAQCNGAADPVPSCDVAGSAGDVRLTGNNLYAVHRVMALSSVGEVWRMEGNDSNPSIFTQPAWLSGIAGNLVTWTTENGEWLYVEGNGTAGGACSSRSVDGITATNNTVEAYHFGMHVASGLLAETSFTGGDLQAEIPLQIDAAGSLTNDSINARLTAVRIGTAAPNATAVVLNSTCTAAFGQESLNLAGIVEQSEGSLIDIEGTGTVWLNAAHLSAFAVGNSATAGAYWLAKLNNSSATLNLNSLVGQTAASGVGGIDGAAGTLNLGQYSIGVTATPLTIGSATVHAIAASNFVQGSGSPTGAGTGGAMMGFCVLITPKTTGNIEATFSGNLTNSTAGDGAEAQMYYSAQGSPNCPGNGAAQTGTALGTLATATVTGTGLVPFATTKVATGLAVGTAYWFDLWVAAVGGGTGSGKFVHFAVHEM
ncbi:MAG TPA: hypothetical protein VGR91_06415 [Stellaceae bacterium]|nr:hypothetical protein [Stellaceae bacterium]